MNGIQSIDIYTYTFIYMVMDTCNWINYKLQTNLQRIFDASDVSILMSFVCSVYLHCSIIVSQSNRISSMRVKADLLFTLLALYVYIYRHDGRYFMDDFLLSIKYQNDSQSKIISIEILDNFTWRLCHTNTQTHKRKINFSNYMSNFLLDVSM